MKLTPPAFVAKWLLRFKPNDDFKIKAADLQEFAQDVSDSFGVTVANVPLYAASVPYAVGYLVRYAVAGQQEAFYYALLDGKLPAPTGTKSDPNWKVVPGPVAATVLSQRITLQEAQGLEGGSVVEGRLYAITGAPVAGVTNPNDNCWNQDGETATVYVRGLENWFERRGVLLDANGMPTQEVAVNVATGTYQQLVTAGSFAQLTGNARDNADLARQLDRKQDKGVATNRHTWYVENVGQTVNGDGSRQAPFANFAAAMNNAQTGDLIIYTPLAEYNQNTQRFECSESFSVTKNVTVVFTAPVPMSNIGVIGDYGSRFNVHNIKIIGLHIASRCPIVKQNSPSKFHFINCFASGNARIDHFGISVDSDLDVVVFDNLVVRDHTLRDFLFYFEERSGYRQGALVYVNGGTLAPAGNLAEGSTQYGPNENSRLILSANTDLRLASGAVLSSLAKLVVDNRVTGGAAPTPSVPEQDYTIVFNGSESVGPDLVTGGGLQVRQVLASSSVATLAYVLGGASTTLPLSGGKTAAFLLPAGEIYWSITYVSGAGDAAIRVYGTQQ